MAVNILPTKLHISRAKTRLVSRPHLLGQLNRIGDYKLILISASAGYGKSTLLSQWVEQSSLDIAWLSLDKGDNDPGRFLAYMINALRTLKAELGQGILELLASPQQPDILALMAGFLQEMRELTGEIVLVLDDYQLIEEKMIHDTITLLLNHLPAHLHLVIASRTAPPLPVARLRAQGELLELRPADLCFVPEEAGFFLNEIMQLDLPGETITGLMALTEGWVTGLQLAALVLQNQGDRTQSLSRFSGNHRYIFDYLANEVFAQQSEAIQDFLLQTAILERLCGELCEAVTGQAGGQTRLAELERANLFLIPLDDEQRWYRYHHLFSDFLARRWQQELPATQFQTLHRRAAQWYAEAGFIEEALNHHLAVKDFEAMARLLEQYTPQIWARGQMVTLRKWAGALPETFIWSKPHLALAYVSTLVDTNYLDEAERHLQQLETLHQIDQQPDSELYDEVLVLRCAIAYFRGDKPTALSLVDQLEVRFPRQNMHLRSFFALNLGSIYSWRGEIERATYYLEEAIKSAHLAGSAYLAFLTRGQLATFQLQWGQLHGAYQTHQQAIHMFKRPLPVTGWMYFSLAGLLYEWNKLTEAAQQLAIGVELYQHRENLATLINASSLKAWLQWQQGKAEAANSTLQEGIELAQQHPETGLLTRLLASQAELALAQGHLDRVGHWAETQSLQPDSLLRQPYEVGRALIGVLLAQGRFRQAMTLLEPLKAAAVTQKQTGRMIQLAVREALAWQGQGNSGRARQHLIEALVLAQPGGYIRSFVDAGPLLAPLLTQLTQPHGLNIAGDEADRIMIYAETLLRAFPPGAIEPGPPSPLLTPRELEVLTLIAAGLTNEQIAARLVIAKGTVKKHLDNLYAKLDVRTRTQAVAQARRSGFLP
jgi:LuxR family transcriptional regulator, maltose regulon positive regulatory protein